MTVINFVFLILAVIGAAFLLVRLAVVVGHINRAIGVTEFNLRLKFRNDNVSRKSTKRDVFRTILWLGSFCSSFSKFRIFKYVTDS